MAAPARWSAPISRSSGACPTRRGASSTARSPAARRNREKMAVVADDRGRHARHALAVRGGVRPRQGARGELAALPAGDRPHAPDPRAHGAYRPPAARRRRATGPGSRPRRSGFRPRRARRFAGLGRQALHAAVLGFEHPVTRRKPAFRERTAARPAASDRSLAAGAARGDARRSVTRRGRVQTKAGARR